jgi:endonuclease/exonuclease/phosphatase family metal-dependent hydrolase
MQPNFLSHGRFFCRSRELVLAVSLVLIVLIGLLPYRNDSLAAAASSAVVPSDRLSFMTFNIRHAKGLDHEVSLPAVGDQIAREGADFVALQEVDRRQWRSGLVNQSHELAQTLHMHYAFAPAYRHGRSEYGVALLSRYPLHHVRAYSLPGGKEPRVVLTAQTELKGHQLTLISTHLGVARSDRELQMPSLLKIVQSIDQPVIMMGDFNMSAADPLMQSLLALLHKVPLQTPAHTVQHGGEIDHILTSYNTGAFARVVGTRASDHKPVLYELNFSARS